MSEERRLGIIEGLRLALAACEAHGTQCWHSAWEMDHDSAVTGCENAILKLIEAMEAKV